jgi:hypothetical protein
MITIFDATRPVKPSRNARRFGAGLLAYVPTVTHSYEPTDAEMSWLREDSARREASNRRMERLADEAAAARRYEAGYVS